MTETRGQVGIGTLIVFIALVLVAAIAAGVLINTAGFLQTQAEATGEESTDQVSNNIQVSSAHGFDDQANDNVDRVEITVGLAPGSDPIDLENAEIQYVDDSGSDVLLHEDDDGSVAGEEFVTQDLGGDTDETMLTDSEERLQIILMFEGDDTNAEDPDTTSVANLEPGEEAQLTITTQDGAQTTVFLTASDPLDTPEDL